MTAQELYEEMCAGANEGSTVRDSLDYACGYYRGAKNEDGLFHPWEQLPETIKEIFILRAVPWLKRHSITEKGR